MEDSQNHVIGSLSWAAGLLDEVEMFVQLEIHWSIFIKYI